jgi:hypothetical protein
MLNHSAKGYVFRGQGQEQALPFGHGREGNIATVVHVERMLAIAKRKSWTSLHNKGLRPGALLVASQFVAVVQNLETLARKMAEQRMLAII